MHLNKGSNDSENALNKKDGAMQLRLLVLVAAVVPAVLGVVGFLRNKTRQVEAVVSP